MRLTYFISCEFGCVDIISRGFGNFNPIADTNTRYPTLRCHSCSSFIRSFNCIQMIILYQASGTISFKIRREREERIRDFNTNQSRLIIFGDLFERFERLIIETNQLE